MQARQDRVTQGFVANLSWVRARPVLTLLEVAWRWAFAIPALLLIYRQLAEVMTAVPWRSTGIESVSANQLLTDPLRASAIVSAFLQTVLPAVLHATLWPAPLLLLAWVVLSALGRLVLLRRMDASLQPRFLSMAALQLLRVLPLLLLACVWWLGVQVLGRAAISEPVAAGAEPQMMLYVGGVIALTLLLFVLSAAFGWIFSLAPLLSAAEQTGALRSLVRAVQVGGLKSGLIEINLVLGIVKIALLILALVFSACPLPFQSVVSDEFLFWWNCGVGVWYCLASDFFHVARLAGYLHQMQGKQIAATAK